MLGVIRYAKPFSQLCTLDPPFRAKIGHGGVAKGRTLFDLGHPSSLSDNRLRRFQFDDERFEYGGLDDAIPEVGYVIARGRSGGIIRQPGTLVEPSVWRQAEGPRHTQECAR